MLVALPLSAYALTFVLFHVGSRNWRASFLNSAVCWGSFVIVSSEGLSVIHALTPASMTVVWSTMSLILAAIWLLIRFRNGPDRLLKAQSLQLGRTDLSLLAGVSILSALIGLTALMSPPNTWDVMTYHLPRVVFWLQQKSLSFYPTQEIRQLVSPPGAELCILQFQALFGSDLLDNLPQWWSFVGCAIGISLVACELGAGMRGQIIASVVCATIPEGVLRASGAENDHVLSLWLVALTWYVLRYSHEKKQALFWGIGAALGLACVTKGTAVVLIAPLLACLPLSWTPTMWKQLILGAPIIISTIAVINVGYWARNTSRFGFPLGPSAVSTTGEFKYTNDTHNLGSIASNVIRNTALHLGTGSRTVDNATQHIATSLVHFLGLNENDPKTTWTGTTFRIPPMNLSEDLAGNLVDVVLIVVTLVVVLFSPSLVRSQVALYVVGLVVAFVAFCAVFRWQPWNTRLHLPLFVLWSAAIGLAFERQLRDITGMVGAVLILAALPSALFNSSRPLIDFHGSSVFKAPRKFLYFRVQPLLFESYVRAAALIDNSLCKEVGIDIPSDGYEYPFLVLLDVRPGGRQMNYTGDEALPLRDGSVCAIFCVECQPTRLAAYRQEFGSPITFETVTVFKRLLPVHR
jgi:hypothetical protein